VILQLANRNVKNEAHFLTRKLRLLMQDDVTLGMMSVKVHTKDVANKTSVFARFAKMRRKIW
jgi:hypothetical protein